jgi:D-alanyl-D-alanine carboxypeptidase/D-alanyl-D-alanine-endopeptidase (penicillin-binding protein 4)
MTVYARRRGARSARRRLFAILVAVVTSLIASACRTPRPAIVPPAPTQARITQLQRAIDAALGNAAVGRGTWGVLVKSLTYGDALYARNPNKLLVPASTMKIVTLAAAVEQLGWDYRYETTAIAVGPLEDGVLGGDLLVVGSGDPTIEGWEGNLSIDRWADELTARGLRRIEGRVIGDDNAFEDEGLGHGWMWDDLAASYSAPVSALQFNQNSAQITVTPGPSTGDKPAVVVTPPWAPLTIHNQLVTTPPDTRPSLTIRPAERSPVVQLSGGVPAQSGGLTRTVAVPNPTLYFAIAVRDALTRHGVDVVGVAADLDDIEQLPDRRNAVVLGTHTLLLRELAMAMMKTSPNLYAESLLKTVGIRASGKGSTDAGRTAIQATLTDWGISSDEVVIADGSGLSRYNLITPHAMVAVLTRIYGDERHRGPFLEALPLAGTDGTLAGRMNGTAAQGRVRAKTGSLTNARALSGYVSTADGEPLAFSIMANNDNAATSTVDAVTDAVAVALAEFSRR